MKKLSSLFGFLMLTHILFAFPPDVQTFRKQTASLKRDYDAIKNVDYNVCYSEHKWTDLNSNIAKINDFHVEIYDDLVRELTEKEYFSDKDVNRINAKQNLRQDYANELSHKGHVEHLWGYSSEKWRTLCLSAEKIFDFDKAAIEELYRFKAEKSKNLLSQAGDLLKSEKSKGNGTSDINWNWLWAVFAAVVIYRMGKKSNS
jgi:hypothetical protein